MVKVVVVVMVVGSMMDYTIILANLGIIEQMGCTDFPETFPKPHDAGSSAIFYA